MWARPSASSNFCLLWEGLVANQFPFPPGYTDRFLPYTTSLSHYLDLYGTRACLSHDSTLNQVPEGGRRASLPTPPSSCLTSLVCSVQCFLLRLSCLGVGDLSPGTGPISLRWSVHKALVWLPTQCSLACCLGWFSVSSCSAFFPQYSVVWPGYLYHNSKCCGLNGVSPKDISSPNP